MSSKKTKRINPDILKTQKSINQDAYGGACVRTAEAIMDYLDTFEGDFNIGYSPDMTTPHGIVCHVDDEGITGFMAGAARNIVAQCHVLGWKFWLADVISPYDVDDGDLVEKRINAVTEQNTIPVDRQTAEAYVDALISRYKKIQKKKEKANA